MGRRRRGRMLDLFIQCVITEWKRRNKVHLELHVCCHFGINYRVTQRIRARENSIL